MLPDRNNSSFRAHTDVFPAQYKFSFPKNLKGGCLSEKLLLPERTPVSSTFLSPYSTDSYTLQTDIDGFYKDGRGFSRDGAGHAHDEGHGQQDIGKEPGKFSLFHFHYSPRLAGYLPESENLVYCCINTCQL